MGAHLVNTSSMNGFWASVGPDTPHTAYAAAKFAVKGFTEALIADFRMNAPHIRVSVVMPGHIGTGIRDNSLKVQTRTDADGLNTEQIGQLRARLTAMGRDAGQYSDADIERMRCGAGAAVRYGCADQCGGGGYDHPGQGQGRAADPRGAGRTRSSTGWCVRTRTTPMSRRVMSVSLVKRAGRWDVEAGTGYPWWTDGYPGRSGVSPRWTCRSPW